jgi:hypothetical protein
MLNDSYQNHGAVLLTYVEGLHLLLEFPPGPLNGLVSAGLVGQGLVRVGKLRNVKHINRNNNLLLLSFYF